MKRLVSDVLLVLLLCSLPLLSIFQACKSSGPVFSDNDILKPYANIVIEGESEGPTPFTVYLRAGESISPITDELNFRWIFSDGNEAVGEKMTHTFIESGKHQVRLVISDRYGNFSESAPVELFAYGLANSSWPKFAHDMRNSGVSQFEGPDAVYYEPGLSVNFPRRWNDDERQIPVTGICTGYDGRIFYTQGTFLTCRSAEGMPLWERDLVSCIRCWPAVAYDGSIITGTDAGVAYRFTQDGELKWTTDISSHLGEPVQLHTAANITNDGVILLGAHTRTIYLDDIARGWLIALSIDGDVLWTTEFEHFKSLIGFPYGNLEENAIIPAILPNSNIVINSIKGRIYTSQGDLFRILDYNPEFPDRSKYDNLGPPSVSADGEIVFTKIYAPVFNSNGDFVTELFRELIRHTVRRYWKIAPLQAPCWSGESIDVLYTRRIATAVPTSSYSVTYRVFDLDFSVPGDNELNSGGIAKDCRDHVYATYCGLTGAEALTMSQFTSVAAVRREPIWRYSMYTIRATPPVIGDNGWLYFGTDCGLAAVGD